MKKKAFISVTDKSNLDVLVKGLSRHDYEIISTGGTAKRIREIIEKNNCKTKLVEVSDFTEFPEIFEGRIKSLHPKILGGILCDWNNVLHKKEAEQNKIVPIHMVVVNLYEFEKTAAIEGVKEEEVIEAIDIGGPTAIICAVKNHKHVAVVTDPDSYSLIIDELDRNKGNISLETKRKLAAFASNMIADYRDVIAVELSKRLAGEQSIRQKFVKGKQLGRYGENWHQRAWLFVDEKTKEKNVVSAKQVNGPPMGFNNYIDAASALEIVKQFKQPCAVVVKHNNPCGIATSDSLVNALERAWQSDPVSAFGSVIAFNRDVDLKTIKVICERTNPQGKKGWFVEVMIAPRFDKEALEYVRTLKTKKNLRMLELGDFSKEQREQFAYKHILGGLLKQERDLKLYLTDIDDLFREPHVVHDNVSGKDLTVGVVTKRKPDKSKKGLFDFAQKACKGVKSNSIVIVREYSLGKYQLLGMGAGQPNRIVSVKLALEKAKENLESEYRVINKKAQDFENAILATEYDGLIKKGREVKSFTKEEYVNQKLRGCVLASDSFFPFEDSIELLAESITQIIQPGGSNRDAEIIKVADKENIVMVFSGTRHFLH